MLERGAGYGLPVLALALAVLLLIGLAVRAAAAVSAVLFALLFVGLVSAAARGLQIACGCAGGGGGDLPAGRPTGFAWQIPLVAVLLLLATGLAIRPSSRYALDDRLRTPAVADVPESRPGRRRTPEARRREAELAEQRAAAGERRVAYAGVLAVVVLVAVTAAGIGVQAARTSNGPSPQAFSVADGVQLGRPGGRVTIEIYEDPSCPDCAGFENQAAAQLKTWMDTSTAKVRFYVVSYLNDASTTKYSSRAAAAMYCAADAGRFPEYHAYLFANQPPPGNEGLTDAQLTSDGHEAGITGPAYDTFAQCIKTAKYADFVSRITDQANRDGILAVPTILVDGDPVQKATLDGVAAAVNAAL